MAKIQGACLRCIIAPIIAAVAVVGCGTTPALQTRSETEIAVSNVKAEWLKDCEVLVGPMPANTIGSLLQDHADISALLAMCIARHNDFAAYMRPIVDREKERGRK